MKLMNQTEKLISSKLSAAKRRSTLVGRERKFSESSGSGSKVNTRRASTIVTPFEVAFVDQQGAPGAHLGGGQFGVPLLDSDVFPGWVRASALYSAMRAANMAMAPIPVRTGALRGRSSRLCSRLSPVAHASRKG